MKKLYSFILAFILFPSLMFAGDVFSYGLSVGYANSGLTWESEGEKQNVVNSHGFTAGFVFEYDPIDYFGIETGVKFFMHSFTIQEPPTSILSRDALSWNMNMYYMALPVYAVAILPLNNFKLFIEAGPDFMYGVAAHRTIKLPGYGMELKDSDGFKDTFLPFNCTIHTGIGAEAAGARFTIGYDFGVFDIGRDNIIENNVRTGAFVLQVGYLF